MRNFEGTHKWAYYKVEEQLEGGVLLIRRSPFTDTLHSIVLNEPFEKFMRYYHGEGLIQEVFPDLTPDEREFVMTGITPVEWDSTFGE